MLLKMATDPLCNYQCIDTIFANNTNNSITSLKRLLAFLYTVISICLDTNPQETDDKRFLLSYTRKSVPNIRRLDSFLGPLFAPYMSGGDIYTGTKAGNFTLFSYHMGHS